MIFLFFLPSVEYSIAEPFHRWKKYLRCSSDRMLSECLSRTMVKLFFLDNILRTDLRVSLPLFATLLKMMYDWSEVIVLLSLLRYSSIDFSCDCLWIVNIFITDRMVLSLNGCDMLEIIFDTFNSISLFLWFRYSWDDLSCWFSSLENDTTMQHKKTTRTLYMIVILRFSKLVMKYATKKSYLHLWNSFIGLYKPNYIWIWRLNFIWFSMCSFLLVNVIDTEPLFVIIVIFLSISC